MDPETTRVAALDERAQKALGEAVAIMARLRGPGGCPWDREQTFDSIKRHTLEETYEVFDAIERRAWPELKDELGDLLLQVLFYSQMAAEAGYFDIGDVAENLNAKLVRRHPHIFGDAVATDADAVLRNWEMIKQEEKKMRPASASMLDDVPRSMPATLEAYKVSAKAAKAGFDWQNVYEIFVKAEEETAELLAEVERGDSDATEAEFGDLMFTLINIGRFMKIDVESALRRTTQKFRTRVAAVEHEIGDVQKLQTMSIEDMESAWARAKAAETKG